MGLRIKNETLEKRRKVRMTRWLSIRNRHPLKRSRRSK
jgi:hypothetical protein